jgi:uncharacterized cupin superfamily protein
MVPDRQLDPYFAEFLPGKISTAPRSHQHFGCEFLYLLSGSLNLRHGETIHRIAEGDAVYFDASTTHSYECPGPSPATALIVTLQQPVLSNGTGPRNGTGPALAARSERKLAAPSLSSKPRAVPRAG